MKTRFALLLVVMVLAGCQTAPEPPPVLPPNYMPATTIVLEGPEELRGLEYAARLAATYIQENRDENAILDAFEVLDHVTDRQRDQYTMVLTMQDGRQWRAGIEVYTWVNRQSVYQVKRLGKVEQEIVETTPEPIEDEKPDEPVEDEASEDGEDEPVEDEAPETGEEK
ncbi:MAG: hypothetical protein AAF492_15925 [Verrucomicrobiota bacterium]